MSKLLEIQLLSAFAALALGAIALVYPILFFRNPDREWAFIEKWRRYGGQPSVRTPEWERTRKIPHVVLILLGVAFLVGGIYLRAARAQAPSSTSFATASFAELGSEHAEAATEAEAVTQALTRRHGASALGDAVLSSFLYGDRLHTRARVTYRRRGVQRA